VTRIAEGPILTDHWKAFLEQKNGGHEARADEPDTPLKPVYVHGFVYDISTGQIYDLSISQGPPGYQADYTKCKRNLFASMRHGYPGASDPEDC